jgi:hypothetical protein
MYILAAVLMTSAKNDASVLVQIYTYTYKSVQTYVNKHTENVFIYTRIRIYILKHLYTYTYSRSYNIGQK